VALALGVILTVIKAGPYTTIHIAVNVIDLVILHSILYIYIIYYIYNVILSTGSITKSMNLGVIVLVIILPVIIIGE
jgi:hypothetical protein